MLRSLNLPELITHSSEEYEALAIQLARHRDQLDLIKLKLAQNRLTAPLFNAPLFAKNIETAYMEVYKRNQAGLAPEHIDIKD
jgi:predicted O-linked N-acetylglucosamine transferase (SPINDLY family)